MRELKKRPQASMIYFECRLLPKPYRGAQQIDLDYIYVGILDEINLGMILLEIIDTLLTLGSSALRHALCRQVDIFEHDFQQKVTLSRKIISIVAYGELGTLFCQW